MARIQEGTGSGAALELFNDPNSAFHSQLETRGGLVDAISTALDLTTEEAIYFDSIPPTLREGLRATVFEALSEGKSVQVQFSPGYDFEVRLWDYGEAVSGHVSGPYGERPGPAA
jgi:hypothetical protein